MSRYISAEIRKFVAERAHHRCEYCRSYARHSFLAFHIEHIISLRHGGNSHPDNLAYSCPVCNIRKGSDIATYIDSEEEPVRLFHPRKDPWDHHFSIEDAGLLLAKSKVGEATIRLLDLNHPDSIIERRALMLNNLF